MPSFSNLAMTALVAGAALVNGHMIMKEPKPFGNPSNGPLDPSGSDFPCKAVAYDRSAVQNVMAIGAPQTLSFTGSAVHGGGSCQVSLTTDLEPTKNSKWMVIKSIEGGCPSSVGGNLPADPNGSGASTFQYTIPEGIAPGEYVIAWTWVNKIGNREFYMNCGPATITGAQKKRYVPNGVSVVRRQSTFPDMFVANIPSVNDCTTPESFDYKYPSPGDAVEEAGSGPYTDLACGAGGSNPAPKPTGAPTTPPAVGGDNTPKPPTIGDGTANTSPKPSSAPAVPAAGSDSASPNGSPVAAPPAAGAGTGAGTGSGTGSGFGAKPSGAPTVQPGNFASGADSAEPVDAPAAAASSAPVAAAPSASAPSAPAAAAPQAPTTPSTAGAQSGACTAEGSWACAADGSAFQRCASGAWSAAIPMAQGMKCTPGTSVNLQMSAA